MDTGQIAGMEAVIHAVCHCFDEESTEGVPLVDACNTFNFLNRDLALFNIRHLCPALASTAINCH